VNAKGKEIREKICVERFLNWYNTQYNAKYTYQKATDRFPDLIGGQDWDSVVCERGNPQDWIGIEVEELQTLRKVSEEFRFWQELSSDLTRYLQNEGIQGEFEIGLPRAVHARGKRGRLCQALGRVLAKKGRDWELGETKDIGPDVAGEFPNWPIQESVVDEWDRWGGHRPCKLEVKKVSDSGCKVRALTSPLRLGDVVQENKKAFDEVFKLKNGRIHADEQLELAQTRGTRKTILLLADVGVDEGLTRECVHNLDRDAISHIDCVYLVDMSDNGVVTKICR
jgi:hypothetical protein